jgi:hypothetical protein
MEWMVNRRRFLLRAGVATALLGRPGFANATHQAEVTILDKPDGRVIPLDYTGLSYELSQLSEPGFFAAANHDLVAYFRLLSKNGVLRLGGNTSEFCWFRADVSTEAPKLHVPPGNLEANWMPHRLFEIVPEAIDNLGGFLEATGWRLIYGLNFGNSTPERAATEAAYVARKLGKYLEYFQIGNEPDLYQKASNGTRPPGWGFDDYAGEWIGFARAVRARVPEARFGGPDVAASSDWVTRFGDQETAKMVGSLVALTGHYYAEGPPDDPRATTERLLAGDARVAAQMQTVEAFAEAHSLHYRMTEGNSCYRGGKPGMSNAFAAALWAGDYMLLLASLRCAGVNVHGGDSRFLTAGLGGHTPGLDAAKQPQAMPSGFYTLIASERGGVVHAMPIFYGMMVANVLAGMTMMDTKLGGGGNATSYAATGPEGTRVAVFNKDGGRGMDLSIRTPRGMKTATAWRLRAPGLDATEGVTLAGAAVGEHGVWAPKTVEPVAVRDGAARLQVPAASAALVFPS